MTLPLPPARDCKHVPQCKLGKREKKTQSLVLGGGRLLLIILTAPLMHPIDPLHLNPSIDPNFALLIPSPQRSRMFQTSWTSAAWLSLHKLRFATTSAAMPWGPEAVRSSAAHFLAGVYVRRCINCARRPSGGRSSSSKPWASADMLREGHVT